MNAYNALTAPYYGLISLGNDCKTYLDKILILQERALRLIYSANTQHDAIPSGLFVKAKVLILNVLYYESVLNLMHDIDERNEWINILNLFSRTSNSHQYFTPRSSTSQYLVRIKGNKPKTKIRIK